VTETRATMNRPGPGGPLGYVAYVALALLGGAAAVTACGASSSGSAPDSGPPGDTTVDGGADASCTLSDASLENFMPPDASLDDGAVTGSGCWACVRGGCSAQIAACSEDCTCNATFLGGAQCLAADGGNLLTCVLPLLGSSGIVGFLTGGGSGVNSSLMNLASCTMAAGCLNSCAGPGITGPDGGFIIPSFDGGTGTDAGATSEVDAGVDSGAGQGLDSGADAMTDGGTPAPDGG
jgi:hypothetical protein